VRGCARLCAAVRNRTPRVNAAFDFSRGPTQGFRSVTPAAIRCQSGANPAPIRPPPVVRKVLPMPSPVKPNMFTAAEIRAHRDRLPQFLDAASDFLDWVFADHLAFHDKWGVSKYYGNRRPDYRTAEGRAAALRRIGKPEFLATQQVGTACVLLAMQGLERGFAATGTANTWKKINAVLKINNNFHGTDLQMMLQQLGWKLYYWNPDPAKNAAWDAEDQALMPLKPGRKWMPGWGGHALRHAAVMARDVYFESRIDNKSKLVGFGSVQPAGFRDVPYFVGIAHAGYHVFPGHKGMVVEAHSTRDIAARDNIEVSPFNPLKAGGGPRWTRVEKYRSGILAVPADF
jgi:hypothetical protein